MLFVFIINCMVALTAVLIHYEILSWLSAIMPKLKVKNRLRIAFGVCGALLAHVFEVWLFAVVYFFMNNAKSWGVLTGNFDNSLLDCVYFSFTTISTLGFGDITPIGHLRYLTGIESLVGLVLISWSASFLYVEMQRHWNK